MASNPAIEVQNYGQSLWLDYIHRRDLENGELKRRIDEQGIRGVTSNPSIFQQAIGDSSTYDATMQELLDLDAGQIYERLAFADIQAATDLFRPIYDESEGRDGYVSLEVSPLLANDTAATLAEAKRLFKTIDRPNLMVKIPGTEAGITAIEEATAAGINVNVTLLFAVTNYEQVAQAYIRGLERRLEAGEDVSHIASVASFFLSRIDTAVDRILENNMRAAQVHGDPARIAANRRLLGQAAIANAKLAYRAFQRIFKSSRFQTLRDAGAQVQRPLWASTSNKNPAYQDTRYVDMLIGQDTVNTVPPKTLEAFIREGTAAETLTRNLQDFLPPDEVMDKLAELGINIEQVTHRLQVDGVDAFIDSFETLLEQVHAKCMVLKTGVMARTKMALGIYANEIDKNFVNGRIWNKDGSLWTTHNPTIQLVENRLGWLDVLETMDLERLKQLQARIKKDDFTHLVLMGMGGSSLTPGVLYRTFGRQDNFPAFYVLDSTDPGCIRQMEDRIDIAKTLFIVASKSGTTIETRAFYQYFYAQTGHNAAQFIIITDPETPLAQLAQDENFYDLFLNPPDIGGRYSALSYFGMVPAALMGLDIDRLWSSAERMIHASHENVQGQFHPGISLGALIGALALKQRDKVTIYTTQSLRAFGDWAEQLLAESLGKDRRGVVPVVGTSLGKPHEYATDRLFIYLRVDDDPDTEVMDTGVRTLREAGHPRSTLRLPDAYSIAGEFFRWEYATAIAGYLLKLNPFDEPNVAEAKAATQNKLAYFEEHGQLPELVPVISGEHTLLYSTETTVEPLREMCRAHGYDPNSRTEVLAAQIAGTHAGDYFAFLCYFTPDEATEHIMHDIQRRLRNVTKRAVTVGYGPRYLHSTGQLHKGGANTGVFFQIMTVCEQDLAIPDETYSFGTLFQAQADGDLEILQKRERRVFRLHIEDDLATGLQKIVAAIKFVEDRRF